MKTYYLYILECNNNSYYIGYTTDMERRWAEHQQGSSKCKYTRSFPPKRIAAYWELSATLSAVLSLERQLKRLSKDQKLKLIQQPKKISCFLSEKPVLSTLSFQKPRKE